MLRIILIITGFISLILGIIGIFVPLLPTTPFLLLTTFCFSKSSKRFNNILLNNKFLFKYIDDYKKGKGIKPGIKISAILFLWTGLLFGMFFYKISNIYLLLSLLITGIAVSVHILLIRKKTP
jgi:uncharacterized membrane protein YbaN (DUF454 family)